MNANPAPITRLQPTPAKPRSFVRFALATAGLFILPMSAFAQIDLYFNSNERADWHTAGIWSTQPDGSDSVNWTDGNHANLISSANNLTGGLTIDLNQNVTVQSLSKVYEETSHSITIFGTGAPTFTNTSGIYHNVGGAALQLSRVSVAGHDTVTKTGSGALIFQSDIRGFTPTHFDVQEGVVHWNDDATHWNTSTSIHIDAGAQFGIIRDEAGSFETTGLTGAGDFAVKVDNNPKELVLNIAAGSPVQFDGDIVRVAAGDTERLDIVKTGAGTQILGGVIEDLVGDVTVNDGTLGFAEGGELSFTLEDGGVTNQVLGTGTVNFDGLFRLDIDEITTIEGSWQLVDVANLNETFGETFNLAFVEGPTFDDQGGGVYTSDDWVFDTGTGTLQLVPEPSASLLAGLAFLWWFVLRCRRFVSR